MADGNRTVLHELDEIADVDTQLGEDDELANLFAAFDDVSASDALQEATLARIRTMSGEADSHAATAAGATDTSAAPGTAATPSFKAAAGGKPPQAARRAKWRAIRVAAIAACLALALTGGVAYATPVSYYEITQNTATVTLGVNCFGVTVSASSDNEEGQAIVESVDLCNMRYEDSLSRAIGKMEESNPEDAIEFGPRGGERETLQPRDRRSGDNPPADGSGNPEQAGFENADRPSPDAVGQGGQNPGKADNADPASPPNNSESQPQGQSGASPAPSREAAESPKPTAAPDETPQPGTH